ncbi:DUF2273 domain-containing protein [Marinisporobacter balticus]|uniref:Small integral membrane protein DUF2273 n=1 Tax=Marinisporobacter balticus TaxID=2018667 RepID=A0A4R2L0V5_9FIRM|nr:DUF2273 domain-containing protein [Marinisporobacter balticus]TCO79192.1 small integral membrane protein DUF2273 [Marinisporobacter balticus]
MNREKIFDIVLNNYGKITGVLLGLIFSVLMIEIGIIKTIFISLCIYIGYFFGSKIDKKENIQEFLDRMLPLGKYK